MKGSYLALLSTLLYLAFSVTVYKCDILIAGGTLAALGAAI